MENNLEKQLEKMFVNLMSNQSNTGGGSSVNQQFSTNENPYLNLFQEALSKELNPLYAKINKTKRESENTLNQPDEYYKKQMNSMLKQSLREMQDPERERAERIAKFNREPKQSNYQILFTHRLTTEKLRSDPTEILISFPAQKAEKQQQQQLQQLNNCKEKDDFVSVLRTSNLNVKTTKANCNLNSLSKILISQLNIEQTHFGKYMLLKIIEKPFKRNAIQFILEDERGDCINCSIYNLEKKHCLTSYTDVDMLFPVGALMVICEPYFKVYLSLSCGLRIDDPEEAFVFKSIADFNMHLALNESATAEELKELGNKCMAEGQAAKAANLYKQALGKLKSSTESELKGILYSNLAEAFLRMGSYTKAADAAREAIKNLNPLNSAKALFRQAKALYNLKQYELCLQNLKANEALTKSAIKEIKESVSKLETECARKIETQRLGNYDFSKLLEDEAKVFYLDYADYVNEKVEITFAAGKGVSVKAKEKINKGELVSGTKAFVCVSLLEKSDDSIFNKNNRKNEFDIFKGKEPKREVFVESTQEEVRRKILELLINKEEDHKEFFALFDGSNKNQDYEARVNCLESYIDNKNSMQYQTEKNKDKDNELNKKIEKKFDSNFTVSKIDRILKHNAFKTTRGLLKQKFIASGLWIFPSFLNHSCVANTSYFGIGDFLFLKAQRDIEQNEEITLSYQTYEDRFDKRFETLKDNWGFSCDCPFCAYQSKNFKDNKTKLYAFDFIQCLREALKKQKIDLIKKADNQYKNKIESWDGNEFKDIAQDLIKERENAQYVKSYKVRVNEMTKQQWLNVFNKNRREFYEYLMENRKEFSKIEMCILLTNYSHLILEMGTIDYALYSEILEKAYSYCNCFQIIYEVQLLVSLVQFYLVHFDSVKFTIYKSKLTKLLNEFYGDNEDLHKIFLNAIQF